MKKIARSIMRITGRTPSRLPHMTPLAACLAAALALTAPPATAFNRVVQNCNDNGSGSLREIVTAQANNGDTVDLSQLACSTITLTTGQITVIVNNLTLTAGPGATGSMTIDGGLSAGHHNRVLAHTGTGTLSVQGLTITDAKYDSGPAFQGGCIFSSGNVDLTGSTVSHCAVVGSAASNSQGTAHGGGIFAFGNVHLIGSTVTGNVAQAIGTNFALGGGIDSVGNVVALYSTISHNKAVAAAQQRARGGGLYSNANLNIGYSTISNNQAQVDGGVYLKQGSGSHTAVITNSTISGNSSSDQSIGSGGINDVNVPLTLSNSTIAFNTSANSTFPAGLFVGAAANLQSSIIADNLAAGVPSDLLTTGVLTGADNLIYHSNSSLAPLTNTIVGQCPKLGPLADNFASPPASQTHALLPNSPAINTGNNALGLMNDERGAPFLRVFGIAADIGAYEWQGGAVDPIFKSGFESGCDE
ncbi:MAG: choice-of-anchor Q domain-containing protein [Dokdonella sp.]